jgi:hypothetical protein
VLRQWTKAMQAQHSSINRYRFLAQAYLSHRNGQLALIRPVKTVIDGVQVSLCAVVDGIA